MKVRDVMTSDVVSVGPEASIDEAVQLMLQRRISGLPVIDHAGELVGVVTEGDFLRRAETALSANDLAGLSFSPVQASSQASMFRPADAKSTKS